MPTWGALGVGWIDFERRNNEKRNQFTPHVRIRVRTGTPNT